MYILIYDKLLASHGYSFYRYFEYIIVKKLDESTKYCKLCTFSTFRYKIENLRKKKIKDGNL